MEYSTWKKCRTVMEKEEHEIIFVCHQLGLRQKEIVEILSNLYGIFLSDRQLRRILKRSDIVEVAEFINDQIGMSGQFHGYRFMHLKCMLSGLTISRENVRRLLSLLDPEGVEHRRRRRLVRRRYYAKGPNFIWHLDSYDKLKPYGIAINGCIDGFSRHVIWLEANYTSSDPKVVGGYFVNAVKDRGFCPQIVRGDRGTENSHVQHIQTFFHNLQQGIGRCFLYGRSTANQRIESYWCQLRKQKFEFWISFFHQLKEHGYFCGDLIEKEIIRFVFVDIIQVELDDFSLLWNTHYIRKTHNEQIAYGRPDLMYTVPAMFNTRDYSTSVDDVTVNVCQEECIFKTRIHCDKDVHDVCRLLMEENN
ncbi:hypothetical protein KUTeg_012655, partial [Tegillarca granosa]